MRTATVVVHADWGLSARKRWIARARSHGEGWLIDGGHGWDGAASTPLARLGAAEPGARVLVGADFPIGLPAAFARRAGLPPFPEALELFGTGRWSEFLTVATTASEVSCRRPFYPRAPGGASRAHLTDGLGLTYAQLLRECERATPTRRAACSVFWTLGANQVGKGAIAGWVELVRPLVAGGAALWPFDGELPGLVESHAVTVAETYPAEYHASLGIGGAGGSKRRQADRAARAPALADAAAGLGARLAPAVDARVLDGFGPGGDGEDPFDALVGLLGMLRALRDGSTAPGGAAVREHEGWILGQAVPEDGEMIGSTSRAAEPEVPTASGRRARI